ncbi:hypothetical protein PoB_006514900 [Plakobranchus ocellatus]|uniref:Uncharacterized protein n=1 Tax=Plakobranchus ocellatus TaxID=259542 RepID=A0AAV4D3C4_9GAST|nr:hypothetical protein PoB_006514900 [Plakobranchus ocellatus]
MSQVINSRHAPDQNSGTRSGSGSSLIGHAWVCIEGTNGAEHRVKTSPLNFRRLTKVEEKARMKLLQEIGKTK